jgi:hypothetical protein
MWKLGVGLCIGMLAGCSTITTGTTQPVSVVTPGVDGANCELTSPEIGTINVVTPAQAILPKSQYSVKVACHKECYTEGQGLITSTFEEMTAGNLLIGGVVGVAVDASSGAMNKYDPRVEIAMHPVASCGKAKKKI